MMDQSKNQSLRWGSYGLSCCEQHTDPQPRWDEQSPKKYGGSTGIISCEPSQIEPCTSQCKRPSKEQKYDEVGEIQV